MFSAEQAKGLSMFIIQGFEGEIKTTAKLLAAVPEDKLGFVLGDKGRTIKDLMWHIVESDIWFANGIANCAFAGPEATRPAPATVAEIVAFYQKEMPASLEKVKAMSGEQLTTPVDFFGMMTMPVVTYLQFMNNHCIHHRGQLSTYVRAMNAYVPSIYGPSADEGMSAGA